MEYLREEVLNMYCVEKIKCHINGVLEKWIVANGVLNREFFIDRVLDRCCLNRWNFGLVDYVIDVMLDRWSVGFIEY